MTKQRIFSILAVLIMVGVYTYEYILENKEASELVLDGKTEKDTTNSFFMPTSTTGQIVHHKGYSLSYSEPHEQAEWVAYELKKDHLSQTHHKRPYFEIDKAVKTGAASWRNYKKSGYDKGHLCPAGDRRFTKAAHDETFLTSNISPQEHKFNAGIWNTLEQKIRYWARKYDGVYVVTGGVLKGDMRTIGTEQVSVPNAFYKVIIDMNSGSPKMLGFLMPHENSNKPLYDFVVPVDKIEALTGIDFFPELEDALETKLEASSAYKDWSF